MADITKSGSASLDAMGAQWVARLSGFTAGQTLNAVSPVYISGSQVLMSSSAVVESKGLIGASGSANRVRCDGFVAKDYSAGDPVTIWLDGARFSYYATALDSGSPLFVGTSAGGLSVTPLASGDCFPVARVLDGTDIVVKIH